jgi:hypothetical protein
MKRLCAVVLWVGAVSCGPPDGGTDGGVDAADAGDGGGDGGTARFTRPAGHASLTFFVDDRANHTYREGALYWKGTFRYDAQTNVAAYDATWGGVGDGQAGPWPRLYDDGPVAAGGHEAPGATAGDDIFSVEVYVASDAERRYDYGLANEDFNWIWPRKNGSITVPAGSDAVLAADGLVIPAFGDMDLGALHADFAGAGAGGVFVKGSMNSWKAVQLDCDPAPCTYVLSETLGPHDGLVRLEQEVQFVFVFNDAQGLEYKVGGDAVLEGVAAYTDYETRGVWREETVERREESRSSAKNTALFVGGESTAGQPEILLVNPSTGKAGDAVTITGTGFDAAAEVLFGDAPATVTDASGAPTTLVVTAPAHAPGAVGVTVRNPGGLEHTYAFAFSYLDTSLTQIGWCMAEGAASVRIANGDAHEMSALVWTANVTPGSGPGPGIEAQWAKGPVNSDPAGWPGWAAASYRASVDGTTSGDLANDRWGYAWTASEAGTHAWAIRVRLNGGAWTTCDRTGTGDGFAAADLGRIEVTAAGVPVVDAIAPRGFPPGGGAMTITGSALDGVTAVELGDLALAVTAQSATSITATVPASAGDALGKRDITLRDADGDVVMNGAISYVLRFAPTVDGAFTEWPQFTRVAQRPGGKQKAWGGNNVLDTLYVGFDDAKLYLGVAGKVETGNTTNAMLVYLDTQSGGVANIASLTDGAGQPDNALSAGFDASGVTGFGADFGFGFLGNGTAGLRGFADAGNFPWFTTDVAVAGASDAGFEAALPWAALLGGPPPADGATVRLFVRLGNDTGFQQSDESLPADAAGWTVSQVFSFEVR